MNKEYENWTESSEPYNGFETREIYCPLCGEKIKVTFRKPHIEEDEVNPNHHPPKARFHHCGGKTVRMKITEFDPRYKAELVGDVEVYYPTLTCPLCGKEYKRRSLWNHLKPCANRHGVDYEKAKEMVDYEGIY